MPVRGSDDQERGDFEGGDQDDGDVLHGELGSGISQKQMNYQRSQDGIKLPNINRR